MWRGSAKVEFTLSTGKVISEKSPPRGKEKAHQKGRGRERAIKFEDQKETFMEIFIGGLAKMSESPV